jgi:demethylmenaquinone methyltransferase / 2-methoxy-6-polyprenyl-1,4-benzoquinol methylase
MMTKKIVPYSSSTDTKRVQVEKMFDTIAGKYDRLNSLLSLGMDTGWRKKVLKIVAEKNPQTILDIATGTGDMAILLSATNAGYILATDISTGMLKVADEKIAALNLQDRIKTSVQDTEHLELTDNSFDAVTVCYGIRNFENLSVGLAEIYRVMKHNGFFVILETSVPTNWVMKSGYWVYTRIGMPLVMKLLSKDKQAYTYLSKSAAEFPYGRKLGKILEQAGFANIRIMPQFFGASTIYYAEKH